MNHVLKWVGIVLGSVVALLLVAFAGVYIASSGRINKKYVANPPALAIPTDSASIERGHHLATAVALCFDCHGTDFSGKVVIDDPAFGRISGANLTRASSGLGARLTDADWVRAVRDGVRPDGTPIPIMPSEDYAQFGDADLAAIIAWGKSVPPVEKTLPAIRYGPLGRALFVAGKLPLFAAEVVDHQAPIKPAVPAAQTAEYGRYLAAGCRGCHRQDLSGGPVPGTPPSFPPARNITPAGIGDWAEEDFFRVLREGKRPDGSVLNEFMPYRYLKFLTDDELRALWAYLKTVPRKG